MYNTRGMKKLTVGCSFFLCVLPVWAAQPEELSLPPDTYADTEVMTNVSLSATGKPWVIIDTDLGSSMDDLFTIDFAVRMHRAGKFDLKAVMMNRPDKSDEEGRGEFLKFADRYLAALGFSDLPLGASTPLADERLPQNVFNPYWTLIYSNDVSGVSALMPVNRTDAELEELANAVSLYRQLLDGAPDKSVVICSIGFLNNLKALMESGAYYEGDDIQYTGLELIAAKVKELRIMGGCFDPANAPEGTGDAEYNVAGNPIAAKMVLEMWPSPVIVSPWEVGLKLDYKPEDVIKDFPVGTLDPVLRAAYVYWPMPAGEDEMNRLWDLMTVFPLVEGETFAPLSEKGGISVDEFGVTTFTPNAASNRCYQVASNMNETAVLNRFREICRMGNPSITMFEGGTPVPGVDYNGCEMVFKFENIQYGSYEEEDLKFCFIIDGAEYAPESAEWDEMLEVLSVRFAIPADAVTAGNVYNGTLVVALENDTFGPVQVMTASRQLVQGVLEGNVVNSNLARIDGVGEYATVADAVAEAAGRPIRLLHAACWSPSESDFGKSFRFLNKSLIEFDFGDFPSDCLENWTDVDGDNGTLALYCVVTTETPILFATAEEATNALPCAIFVPSAEVSDVLDSDVARERYVGWFRLDVVSKTSDEWYIKATLTDAAKTALAETVAAATRQIPVADIAAMANNATTNVTVAGCEPGFYYTLYGGQGLTALPETGTVYGPSICSVDGKVSFPTVAKPSDAAGFFSIGVSTTQEELTNERP